MRLSINKWLIRRRLTKKSFCKYPWRLYRKTEKHHSLASSKTSNVVFTLAVRLLYVLYIKQLFFLHLPQSVPRPLLATTLKLSLSGCLHCIHATFLHLAANFNECDVAKFESLRGIN